jgi:hypothetical protein
MLSVVFLLKYCLNFIALVQYSRPIVHVVGGVEANIGPLT